MTAAAKTYHHGDLRNALIIAGAQLIEESGSLNFAMADAARRAGVSTAAPYRHFRDKDALLEAISQLAFYGLGVAAVEAAARTRRGSIERIISLGHTYTAYVQEKAAFYDLMWGDAGARAIDGENFDRKASGFFQLLDAVSAYLEEEGIEGVDELETALQLWAMVHGMASISMSGKLPHFHPDADVPAMLEGAVHTFMGGLKARG